jgi:hypothetical protein
VLLGVPGGALVQRPVHGRGDPVPGVQRRDRRVGAQHQLGPGVGQRPVGEGAAGGPGPVQVGGVPVVDGVPRLHAGDHPERGEARQVDLVHLLGVLDPAGDPGGGEPVEGDRGGPVADGVHGPVQPGAGGPAQQPRQLLGRGAQQAVGPRAGVGQRAEGGAGAQRPVDEHLERADPQPVGGHRVGHPGQRVAAAQPGGDRRLQPVDPDRGAHPQRRAAGAQRRPPRPGGHQVAVLEVGDGGDPAGGGRSRGIEHPAVDHRGVGPAGAGEDLHRLVLPHHPGRVGHPEQPGGGGAAPGGVQVAADQHDRHTGQGGVQHRGMCGLGPERVPEALADDHGPRRVARGGGHQRSGLGGRARGRDVDPLPRRRPLLHVHVGVDQPGQQDGAVEVEHLPGRGQVGADRRHPAVLDPDVADRRPEPGAAQQQAAHPATCPARRARKTSSGQAEMPPSRTDAAVPSSAHV